MASPNESSTVPSVWKEADLRTNLPCGEFSEFKEALQQMRAIDDKIIYKLNTSIPTVSFSDQVSATKECQHLYELLQGAYTTRSKAIQKCVDETTRNVRDLKAERETGGESLANTKALRKEQNKLRLMNSELVVEDIVKERSMKVFRERCWQAYKPPSL